MSSDGLKICWGQLRKSGSGQNAGIWVKRWVYAELGCKAEQDKEGVRKRGLDRGRW